MKRLLVPVVVVLVTLCADQSSKAWARSALPDNRPVAVIDGFWDWELSYNPGAAFSVLGDGGARWALAAIAFGASLAIGWMLWRAPRERRALRIGLALVLGGAVGNLIDRVGAGVVTDFVRWRWHEHRWPIFNVADAALLIGAALLIFDSIASRGKVGHDDRTADPRGDRRRSGGPTGSARLLRVRQQQ
jgi:signal peptidase II